jgi:hypothetical protein
MVADFLYVIAIIAERKGLELTRQPKKNMYMYIEDVAESAGVLLTTTEMMFDCGWLRAVTLLLLHM